MNQAQLAAGFLLFILGVELNCAALWPQSAALRLVRRKAALSTRDLRIHRFHQMQNKMFTRHVLLNKLAESTEDPISNQKSTSMLASVATNKLIMMLSNPSDFVKWNLTVRDLNNLRRMAVWLKSDEGAKTLEGFKQKQSNTTSLDCVETLLKLLTDETNIDVDNMNFLNKTKCALKEEERVAEPRHYPRRRLSNRANRARSDLFPAKSPWKLCLGKLRIGRPSLQSCCKCQNKATQRQRYACYACECHNLTSIGQIPDFVKENVFELRLINFKGRQLTRGNAKIIDFINTQSLTIKESKSLFALKSKDLSNMMNLQSLTIIDVPSLTLIDPLIFTVQPISQIAHLVISNTSLTMLPINDTAMTQLEDVHLANNRFLCGYPQNCWLFTTDPLQNSNQQTIEVSIDKCIYRGIKFNPEMSNCTTCSSEPNPCPNDNQLCIAVEKTFSCLTSRESRKKESCPNVPIPHSCACTHYKCECGEISNSGDQKVFSSNSDKSSIRTITLTSTPTVSLSRDWLCSFPELKEISMSRVERLTIDRQAFKMNLILEKLKVVGRRSAGSSTVSMTRSSFMKSSLTSVHFEDIDTPVDILGVLADLSDHLRELKLVNVELAEIPKKLNSFSKLHQIDLTSNSITQIAKESFDRIQGLVRFNLTDNPLECSCENQWLHEAASGKASVQGIDFGQITCKMGDGLVADLVDHNPCEICSSFECGQDSYCDKNSAGVSSCIHIDVIENGSTNCLSNGTDMLQAHGAICNQFHSCTGRDTNTVMSCPPKLKFDVKSGQCIPAKASRDGIACFSTANQLSRKRVSSDQIRAILTGFMCPDNIIGIGYRSMNRNLQDQWDEIPENSDAKEFHTIVQFIEYYGIYRHDQIDCQGYHRCHYDESTGDLTHSTSHRCPTGTVFDTQYDKCMDANFEYMKTNPDPVNQCRCNLAIYQHRYIQRFREEYATDPDSVPFTAYDDEDPCADLAEGE